MQPKISKIKELRKDISSATIFDSLDQFSLSFLSKNEIVYIKSKLERSDECMIHQYPNILFFNKIKEEKVTGQQKEQARVAGSKLFDILNLEKIKSVQLMNFSLPDLMMPFLEGLLLSNYRFSKYKKEKDDFCLDEIYVFDKTISAKQISEIQNVIQAVFYARDLVNEPLLYLTASRLAAEIEKLGEEAGFSVEIFNKKKIEALKMGGLLAVNKGSIRSSNLYYSGMET